jgi:hypothetical protein
MVAIIPEIPSNTASSATHGQVLQRERGDWDIRAFFRVRGLAEDGDAAPLAEPLRRLLSAMRPDKLRLLNF